MPPGPSRAFALFIPFVLQPRTAASASAPPARAVVAVKRRGRFILGLLLRLGSCDRPPDRGGACRRRNRRAASIVTADSRRRASASGGEREAVDAGRLARRDAGHEGAFQVEATRRA